MQKKAFKYLMKTQISSSTLDYKESKLKAQSELHAKLIKKESLQFRNGNVGNIITIQLLLEQHK